MGGKNRGRHGENGRLSLAYAELICELCPDFFLFENVKGLWRTNRHRAFFEELKVMLWNSGFKTAEKLINCIDYGAPQDRERIILLGFRDSIDAAMCYRMGALSEFFPWEQFATFDGRNVLGGIWPTTDPFVEDGIFPRPAGVIEELTVEYWFRKNKVWEHPNASHCFAPRAGLSKFKVVAEGDDSRKSYKRLHRWRYSPTACYGNNEVHLHPYKARRISVAEALAIQSAPAGFKLPDNMSLSNMFKTVGNGVPVAAANALAKSIKQFIRVCDGEINGIGPRPSDQRSAKEPSVHVY